MGATKRWLIVAFVTFVALIAVLGWDRHRRKVEIREAVAELERDYSIFMDYKTKTPSWMPRAIARHVHEYFEPRLYFIAFLSIESQTRQIQNGNRSRVGSPPDDHALSLVGKLEGLERLAIYDALEVTDAGLAQLRAQTDLRILVISGAKITDEGISHVAHLSNLRRLGLGQAPITDAACQHLKHLRHMNELELIETSVTKEGIAAIKEALPGCAIYDEAVPRWSGLTQ